ncbi:MAG: endonuclease/exonuclease/phosphatase family metal-dependent hydrolase [Myxococcota bacterium]|jgi:endonuclease/exonuclease/phosphatase family metal-dependent hydrolase
MRIKVATLNVWALPEPFAPDVLSRMTAIGERLATLPADVVAFQEVWTGAARDILLDHGTRAGFTHHWYLDDAIGGSGLLVLSRLPILESDFEHFALSGYPEQLDNGEFLSGKGFARLRLQGADGPFTLINTHLHARYRKRATHQFAPHRIGQIIQLASHVRNADEPLVLVGDLNFGEGSPEYQVLTGITGMRDCAAELDNRFATVLCKNPYRAMKRNPRPDKRIDYVFVLDGASKALRARTLERVFGHAAEDDGEAFAYSNHAGLLAEVEAHAGAPVSPPSFERAAVDLASRLLSEGREEAERRREGGRELSGIGLACAVAAVAVGNSERVNRRRLLKRALRGAAVVALTPSIGYSVMFELLVPGELSAFDRAQKSLGLLADGRSRESVEGTS